MLIFQPPGITVFKVTQICHKTYRLPLAWTFPTQNSFCESFKHSLSLSIIFHIYNSLVLAHWLRNHEDSHHTKPVLSENNSTQICAPACPLCPWKSSRQEPAQAPAVHTDLTRACPSLSQARVKHSHCPALHRLCTCFPLTDLTL